MTDQFAGLIVVPRDEPFPLAKAEVIAARLYSGQVELNQVHADDEFLYFEPTITNGDT